MTGDGVVLVHHPHDTLLTTPLDAVLHFDNTTTCFGQNYTDRLLERYPDALAAYWALTPIPEQREGRVFLSELPADAPHRYLFHIPFSRDWSGNAPLDVVMPQLKAVVDQVEHLALRTIGLYAITLDLFHGPELRGLLKAAFRSLKLRIDIFEP